MYFLSIKLILIRWINWRWVNISDLFPETSNQMVILIIIYMVSYLMIRLSIVKILAGFSLFLFFIGTIIGIATFTGLEPLANWAKSSC